MLLAYDKYLSHDFRFISALCNAFRTAIVHASVYYRPFTL